MKKLMIKSVRVQNFKCFGSLKIDLEPLTVFIGKNDTGKTSMLEAIALWANAKASRSLGEFVKKGKETNQLLIRAELFDGRWSEIIMLHSNSSLGRRGEHPSEMVAVQAPYRFDLSKLRRAATIGVLGKDPLPADGDNFAAALDRLPFKRFSNLQEQLLRRIPMLNEVRCEPSSAHGMKEVWFDVKGAGPLPARQISDGIMLVLAILTVLLDENAPSLIMLEEPETGVHPKQLEQLMELFRDLSKQGTQIILSTHSPYLLDFVPKDAVRVFTRNPDGEVSVKPLAHFEEIQDMMSKGFTLGEAWYNSDEDFLMREGDHARRSGQ